ncbi:hypothetical protein [Lysobacter sp. Root96]|uniref:hypothetical protein n=1 Tax=Lysobacter sp. Root96 TaxID=1736612 RepID=UPI0006FE708F|nr:hypothetical protein [Lysobacter sp. Root96]KRD71424.1 hypothetical protein ASE45_06335 [Lysobacter sp. Root96]
MKLGDYMLAAASEAAWRAIAWIVSRRPVAQYLIRKAKRTPYFHLPGYMDRDWLFNGYEADQHGLSDAGRQRDKRFPWLPSIRIHHIHREDLAKHPHDHPWEWARTIILDRWYIEKREGQPARVLRRGDTALLRFGEYHHIERVAEGGVVTMFIVGPYSGKWGFKVEGRKVQPKAYAAQYPERA